MEKNGEPNQQPSLDNRVAYSPGEFAALFGKHQTWEYRQLYRGTVKAITQCGRIMIPRGEVDRLLCSAKPYNGKIRPVRLMRDSATFQLGDSFHNASHQSRAERHRAREAHGTHAGFIAAGATVASHDVNLTLIPEVPFRLDGERGFLAALERRIRERSHAVIVVAKGAGQEFPGPEPRAARRVWQRQTQGRRRLFASANRGAFPRRRASEWRCIISIRATRFEAASPTPRTRSSATSSHGTPSTRQWPARPAWSWATCTGRHPRADRDADSRAKAHRFRRHLVAASSLPPANRRPLNDPPMNKPTIAYNQRTWSP